MYRSWARRRRVLPKKYWGAGVGLRSQRPGDSSQPELGRQVSKASPLFVGNLMSSTGISRADPNRLTSVSMLYLYVFIQVCYWTDLNDGGPYLCLMRLRGHVSEQACQTNYQSYKTYDTLAAAILVVYENTSTALPQGTSLCTHHIKPSTW